MRRRPVVAFLLKSAPVAVALVASPVAHATSVQTVFSAENALYGAGYAIGQADGWIDDALRSAITQYQSDRQGLAASGELDANTLKALGISASASEVIGGNTVSSRAAALAKLGLSEDRFEQTATFVASVPKPEPKPEPKPVAKTVEITEAESAPQVASTPEPEIEKAPEPDSKPVEIVASVAPEKEKPKPQPVAKTEAPVAKTEAEPAIQEAPAISAEPESEPDSQPVQVTSTFGYSENNNFGSATVEEETPVQDADSTVASNAGDVEAMLPQEPTAAGMAPDSGAAPAEAESSGNVLTKVFDFLFGWMV